MNEVGDIDAVWRQLLAGRPVEVPVQEDGWRTFEQLVALLEDRLAAAERRLLYDGMTQRPEQAHIRVHLH